MSLAEVVSFSWPSHIPQLLHPRQSLVIVKPGLSSTFRNSVCQRQRIFLGDLWFPNLYSNGSQILICIRITQGYPLKIQIPPQLLPFQFSRFGVDRVWGFVFFIRTPAYSFFNFFKILLKHNWFTMIYSVVLYSVIHVQLCIYVYSFSHSFHHGLLQDIEYRSSCYTIGPCCLSILCTIACIC